MLQPVSNKHQNLLADFLKLCRRRGIKATHQRAEIYTELARTDEHPDADTVYRRVRKRVPTISLDTVYRTLHVLEAKGVISRIGALGERTRFDANTDRHHHFVCTGCGLVRDFYSTELDSFSAPREVAAMGAVKSVYIQLRGLCKRCARKRGGSA